MTSTFKNPIVLCAFILLIGFISFMCLHPSSKGIVFLNMRSALSSPIKNIASKMDKKKSDLFMARYNQFLPKTIAHYGKTHHLNIVTATTIYDASGVDITQTIIQENLKRMTSNA